MYLVGWRTEESLWKFIERDGPGTSEVEYAIDYGTYENALRVAQLCKGHRAVRALIRYEIEEVLP